MALKPISHFAEPAIHLIRGQRVMLDSDLAAIYRNGEYRVHRRRSIRKRQSGSDSKSAIRNS